MRGEKETVEARLGKEGEEEKEVEGHRGEDVGHGIDRTESPISTGSVWVQAPYIRAESRCGSSFCRVGAEHAP